MGERKCVNCGHNVRQKEVTGIEDYCDCDNHHIGYLECFEGWCRHWKHDPKWDNQERSDSI